MWKSEKPTEPGYYWMANSEGKVRLVEIWEAEGIGLRMTDLKGMTGAMLGVIPDDYMFSGPLMVPKRSIWKAPKKAS